MRLCVCACVLAAVYRCSSSIQVKYWLTWGHTEPTVCNHHQHHMWCSYVVYTASIPTLRTAQYSDYERCILFGRFMYFMTVANCSNVAVEAVNYNYIYRGNALIWLAVAGDIECNQNNMTVSVDKSFLFCSRSYRTSIRPCHWTDSRCCRKYFNTTLSILGLSHRGHFVGKVPRGNTAR